MNKTEYKKFTKHFDNQNYFHGAVGSNYIDYSWQGVSPAIKTYADEVLKIFPKITEAFDVGGAKGYLVKELLDRGIDAYGFDISKWAVEEGIKEFPELKGRFEQGDILDTDSIQYLKQCDLVICSEVLEHIPEENIDTALENLYNLSSEFVLLDMPLERAEDDKDPTHITIYPREWWDKRISKYFDYYTKHDLHRVAWDFFPLIKKKKI